MHKTRNRYNAEEQPAKVAFLLYLGETANSQPDKIEKNLELLSF